MCFSKQKTLFQTSKWSLCFELTSVYLLVAGLAAGGLLLFSLLISQLNWVKIRALCQFAAVLVYLGRVDIAPLCLFSPFLRFV